MPCHPADFAASLRAAARPTSDPRSSVRAWASAAARVREGEALPLLAAEHGLLFCAVPKAGCTQLRALLLRLRGQPADLSRDPWAAHGGVHRQPLPRATGLQLLPPPSSATHSSLLTTTSTAAAAAVTTTAATGNAISRGAPPLLRFALVRNPLTRLLSAYLFKRGQLRRFGVGSFRQFVEALESQRRRGGARGWRCDAWMVRRRLFPPPPAANMAAKGGRAMARTSMPFAVFQHWMPQTCFCAMGEGGALDAVAQLESPAAIAQLVSMLRDTTTSAVATNAATGTNARASSSSRSSSSSGGDDGGGRARAARAAVATAARAFEGWGAARNASLVAALTHAAHHSSHSKKTTRRWLLHYSPRLLETAQALFADDVRVLGYAAAAAEQLAQLRAFRRCLRGGDIIRTGGGGGGGGGGRSSANSGPGDGDGGGDNDDADDDNVALVERFGSEARAVTQLLRLPGGMPGGPGRLDECVATSALVARRATADLSTACPSPAAA